MYAPWTDGVTLTEACERCGLDEAGRELISHVRAGRLILYGRAGTSEQRSALFGQLELVDPASSSAIFEGERYSDVMAAPALRSVRRIDRVAGRSLSEVFKEYVLSTWVYFNLMMIFPALSIRETDWDDSKWEFGVP